MQPKDHPHTGRLWSPVYKGKTMVVNVKFNHAHRQTIVEIYLQNLIYISGSIQYDSTD
jgi:hypothetical protein